MKNPALVALTVVAIAAALAALVLVAVSISGLTDSMHLSPLGGVRTTRGLELWVAAIPAVVALVAGVGALVLWGSTRTRTE